MPDAESSIIPLVPAEIYDPTSRTSVIMQVHKLIALKEDTPRQLAIYFPHRGNVLAPHRPFPKSNPFFSLSARLDPSPVCCIFRFAAWNRLERSRSLITAEENLM